MYIIRGFLGSSAGKESIFNAGDPGLTPGLGNYPGGGHGNPLPCCWTENPMDRGAWHVVVFGVTKSWTELSN